MSILRAENLFKIFGRRPRDVVRRLKDGATAEELRRSHNATCAVIDATFDVAPGEIFVVMGLSGSGKSTLLRMLNGLLRPTDGRVYVGDREVTSLSAADLRRLRQQRISMVFQHFALLPHRTVLENAAYPLRIRGVEREARQERAREALSLVGLEGWEDKLPHELSGGMKQRVGLARALAAETDIMLMDEAFSALDPLIRREMQDQLLKLQASLHKTIVFITHDLNEAMRLGDRIAVMRAGRIVQIGTAEEILQDPANDYVAQFVQDVDRTKVLTAATVMSEPRSVVIDTAGPRAVLRTMREEQTGAAFVVSRDRRLRGTITEDAAASAVRSGSQRLDQLLAPAATVRPDTVLADIFTPAVASRLPVAVVDDDNRLVGVIPRGTLLVTMANISSTDPTPSSNGEAAQAADAPSAHGNGAVTGPTDTPTATAAARGPAVAPPAAGAPREEA